MNARATERTTRETRQGAAIEQQLAAAADFCTAQDLHARLRAAQMPVGLTTVYRHLQRLGEAGAVDVVRTTSGELAYRRCGDQAHHHHLVCRQCGLVIDIDGSKIESCLDLIGQDAGFTALEHTLELTGTCRACAATPLRHTAT